MQPVPALRPLAWVYGAVVAVRNAAYDAGWKKIESAGVPVVAVGNLTAGGTGKTPLVSEIVRRLQERGKNVGVVSRGFGRTTRGTVVVSDGVNVLVNAVQGGDEPVMIALQRSGVVVVVAERRIDAAREAVQRFAADVIVADDAFQHRSLKRELNVLVVDGNLDLRLEPMLPAGLCREPIGGMKRADILAVSGLQNRESISAIAQAYQRWFTGPVIGFDRAARGIMMADGSGSFSGRSVFAFSGIGNHSGFLGSIRQLGVRIAGDRKFDDHHWYEQRDVEELLLGLKRSGADVLVTTEKDWVRMRDGIVPEMLQGSDVPLGILPIGADVYSGSETLNQLLDTVVSRS
jgi:tetraacyldisaccharide 4'-kinase